MKSKFLSLIFVCAPATAWSCETPVIWTNEQVQERLATIASDTQSEFARLVAYEDLACAARPTVRVLAREEAVKTGLTALNASILTQAMFSRESLVLIPYDDGSLTAEQPKHAITLPAIRYAFTSYEPENGCIEIRHNYCSRSEVIDIQTDRITIFNGSATSELTLSEDGKLRGYYVDEAKIMIPIEAALF